MKMSETIFFASPHPDYIFDEGARVAPNLEGFPADAIIYVETESHFLEFGIEPKPANETGFVIMMVDSLPPLSETLSGKTVCVEGDILKKSQEFALVSVGSSMARQAFKAVRIISNIEGLVPSSSEKRAS